LICGEVVETLIPASEYFQKVGKPVYDTIKLYHVTPTSNILSIMKYGLLPNNFGFVYGNPHKDETLDRQQALKWRGDITLLSFEVPIEEVFIKIPERYLNDLKTVEKHEGYLDFVVERVILPEEIKVEKKN
jgi:hypothetical protein